MSDIAQRSVCLDKNYNEGISQLARSIADKKVVGVGESTHGTHEFFQLRADLACELIAKHGFNTFAIEDESVKGEAINNYIQTGDGDLDELLRPIYDVWRTEEVKDLIVRLKDLATSYEIRFVGIDVDFSVLMQKPGRAMFEERDKLMADNVLRALDSGKIFVWGHNSHVSKRHRSVYNLGRNLAKELGKDYAAVGQFFGQGTFSARKVPKNKKIADEDYKYIPLSPIEVPAPKEGFLEEILHKIDCESYFVDLSSSGRIELLNQVYKCRAFGAVSSGEDVDKWTMKVRPYTYYDALVYFKNAHHTKTIKRKE